MAADFFTIEAWTRPGLQRFVILFFIELSTRKVKIAGTPTRPSGLWMNQVGRNLTDAVDGLLNGKRYLIHDRDPVNVLSWHWGLASVPTLSLIPLRATLKREQLRDRQSTVLLQQRPVKHEVKMKDLLSWLGRQGRSPAEVTLKQKLERILGKTNQTKRQSRKANKTNQQRQISEVRVRAGLWECSACCCPV